MQLFYAPDLSGNEYILSEEESRHCVRVLRKTAGDCITLIDGSGTLVHARITDAHSRGCRVEVVERLEQYGKRPYQLHIALAPTKNIDRYEWFLEKATEIGIDVITPIECDRSERRIVKDERSIKVVTSAVKQSVKAYHPLVNPLTALDHFLSWDFGSTRKFIAHCDADGQRTLLKNAVKPGENCVVLIGPEGDFSPEEVEKAIGKGYEPVSLGESRLRTETAGVVVCATLQLLNES